MPEDDPERSDTRNRDVDVAGDRNRVPDFASSRDRVVRGLVAFVRALRNDGASVPANAARDAAAGLSVVGLEDRDQVEIALRSTLLADPRDVEVFDDHFPAFWAELRASIEDAVAPDTRPVDESPTEDWSLTWSDGPPSKAGEVEAAATGLDETDEGASVVLSGVETVASSDSVRDVDATQRPLAYSTVGHRERLDPDQRASGPSLIETDIRAFERALSALSGRRVRRATGGTIDRRRALRRSLATGGVPVVLPERTRAETEFSPTLLVDVSRSVVDSIDRAFLLAFLARLHRDGRSPRTFFFDTALQDVTGVFDDAGDDPARALERASVEWGGGTRIGAAIRTLEREHPAAVDRRRVVIVVSDGLDVGALDALESGMSWLARRSRVVLWLNPLAAAPAYEPTARGMATALPYVDGLFAFSDSSDLAEIARQIHRRGLGGPLGYRYDSRPRAEAANR